jgi:hypothetical protein
MPMPMWRNLGSRMLARWPGLFIQPRTMARGVARLGSVREGAAPDHVARVKLPGEREAAVGAEGAAPVLAALDVDEADRGGAQLLDRRLRGVLVRVRARGLCSGRGGGGERRGGSGDDQELAHLGLPPKVSRGTRPGPSAARAASCSFLQGRRMRHVGLEGPRRIG